MKHGVIHISATPRFVNIVASLDDDDIVYYNGEKMRVKDIKGINCNALNFSFTLMSNKGE